MRIQHNIPAMSSYRNYTNNASALSKNLEKLSSGYKINRAGDDAAGLAISEKMRAQITGLEVAQKNAKDGISLVQTAEGALTEVHSMLNRMYELAEQSANGTYSDDVDREQLQKEVNQLRTEINRIADSSNFNGIKLLDGSMQDGKDLTITSVDLPEVGDVLATNTVLHQEATETASGSSFSIDLGDLSWTGTTSDKLQISINGQKIAEVQGTGSQINSESLASKIKAAITTAGNSRNNPEVKDSQGNTFWLTTSNQTTNKDSWIKVDINKNKVTFTQIGKPTSEDTVLDPSFTVNISSTGGTFGDGLDTNGKLNYNGKDYNGATTVQNKVTLGDQYRLASTYFDVTQDMVSDGASMTFGNETYRFTADQALKDTQYNVYVGDLDLSTEAGIDTALERLTLVAGGKDVAQTTANTLYTVGHDKGRVTLTELETIRYSGDSANAQYDLRTFDGIKDSIKIKGAPKTGKAVMLQIGDTSQAFNQMNVSIDDMHADAMGIGKIDISTQEGASSAMNAIKDAINYVSNTRGTLGATQNRLDHTINNLSVMQENIQDAESTIRDVDIAAEMMEYTKNNILVQSAQAMLAQANQLPQGVLQLLQ